MNPPCLCDDLKDSLPSLQFGHLRGSPPSSSVRKKCGPSNSLRASRTSLLRSSLVSLIASLNEVQKSCKTDFHSICPPDMSSSFSSSSAVKSYSTYFEKNLTKSELLPLLVYPLAHSLGCQNDLLSSTIQSEWIL